MNAIDPSALRRAYQKLASSYAQSASIAREINRRIVERFDYIKHQPEVILDIGSGVGYGAQLLTEKFPSSKIICLDSVPAMLKQNKALSKRFFKKQFGIAADACQLPLKQESVDLIYSNLCWHWLNDIPGFIKEMTRVLKPGGLLMFSSLGVDSFKEIHQAWKAVAPNYPLRQFPDMHDIGDALLHERFAQPVMDMEYLSLEYADPEAAVYDLRRQGFANYLYERPRALFGKQRFHALLKAMNEAQAHSERYQLTLEIIYGHAWTPAKSRLSQIDDQGEAVFSLEQLRHSLKK